MYFLKSVFSTSSSSIWCALMTYFHYCKPLASSHPRTCWGCTSTWPGPAPQRHPGHSSFPLAPGFPSTPPPSPALFPSSSWDPLEPCTSTVLYGCYSSYCFPQLHYLRLLLASSLNQLDSRMIIIFPGWQPEFLPFSLLPSNALSVHQGQRQEWEEREMDESRNQGYLGFFKWFSLEHYIQPFKSPMEDLWGRVMGFGDETVSR